MTTLDYRAATFRGLQMGLESRRQAVFTAWAVYGPGTTRQVSEAAGIDILMFRPRTTELLQMGLLKIAGSGSSGKEGVYRLATEEEWEDWRKAKVSGQMLML